MDADSISVSVLCWSLLRSVLSAQSQAVPPPHQRADKIANMKWSRASLILKAILFWGISPSSCFKTNNCSHEQLEDWRSDLLFKNPDFSQIM